jgi:hypothetical protein
MAKLNKVSCLTVNRIKGSFTGSRGLRVRLAVQGTARSAAENMTLFRVNDKAGRNPFTSFSGIKSSVNNLLREALGHHLRGLSSAMHQAGAAIGKMMHAEVIRLVRETPVTSGNYTDRYERWKLAHGKHILEKSGELLNSLRAVFEVR